MRLPAPTALGWKAGLFYLVLVAAFFAAPYANLFFLLIAFLTVLGLLNLLWTGRNLSGVAAELREIQPVPAGSANEFHARVDTGTRWRFGIALQVVAEGIDPITALRPDLRGESLLTGTIPPLTRGIYPIRRAWLLSTWPLGLLRARAPLDAPEELVVFPEPAPFTEGGTPAGGPGSREEAWGSAEGLLQPSELREYRPGDELRRVHWKASARRGDLVVTEFEGGAGAGTEVLLDRRAEPAPLESALSLLSAMALASQERKELLTLHSQGFTGTFGTGHGTWADLLRFLAGAEALPADGPAPPPASPGILRLPRREDAR